MRCPAQSKSSRTETTISLGVSILRMLQARSRVHAGEQLIVTRVDGRTTRVCRTCRRERVLAHYHHNPATRNAYKDEWRRRNRDRVNKRQRERRQQNRDSLNARRREQYRQRKEAAS